MLRIIVDEQADADLDQIFDYIAAHNPAAAKRVYEAAHQMFERLASMPAIGRVEDFGRPVLQGIRMIPLSRFPNYLVYYRKRNDELHILRVMHGAQDLATYWKQVGLP
jgi:plasmid stabilization system protein ParE